MGVVSVLTLMRKLPEASIVRVIRENGMSVFPIEPASATYEASVMVKPKPCNALLYI